LANMGDGTHYNASIPAKRQSVPPRSGDEKADGTGRLFQGQLLIAQHTSDEEITHG